MSGFLINPYIVGAGAPPAGTTISYLNQSKDVSAQEADLQDSSFNNDGSKFYIVGKNSDQVQEFSLSTNYDISTAGAPVDTFNIASQEPNAASMFFKLDGTSFYITGSGNVVYQYDLSVAFDLTTASYASKSANVSAQVGNAHGLSFGDSGTKMYVADISSGVIYQYTLSSAWDVSTASYASLSFTTGVGALAGIAITSTGSELFAIGNTSDEIVEFDFGTNWDISSLSATGYTFDVSTQSGNVRDISISQDDAILLYSAAVENTAYNYSLTL